MRQGSESIAFRGKWRENCDVSLDGVLDAASLELAIRDCKEHENSIPVVEVFGDKTVWAAIASKAQK